MKKIMMSLIIVLFLLVFASFAFAVGSSSGGSSSGSGGSSKNSVTEPEIEKVDCEKILTLSGRIQCRFENKENLEVTNYVEEACRNHEKTQECISLYRNSESCYELIGISKHRCFIEKAGLSENQNLYTASEDNKRNYIILLLYDLQEKIEEKEKNGQISTEKATEIVTLIVEIKRDLLTNEPKSEIKLKIQGLKSKY